MASTEFVDPYLDPETGLLRNKVGAQTKVALDEAECDLSFARLVQLMDHPVKPTGDLDELRADNELRGMRREQFIDRLAYHYDQFNYVHPFREGNGRTGKVFMEHVAERSRFTLDFSQVPPDVWNNASAMSRPDIGSYRPVPDSLVPVFERLAVPRTHERTHERTRDAGRVSPLPDKKDPPSLEERIDDKLHELRARRKASYPKPATHVIRTAPEVRNGAKPYRPRGDRGVGSR